jgi:hypothetical protein
MGGSASRESDPDTSQSRKVAAWMKLLGDTCSLFLCDHSDHVRVEENSESPS